MRRQRDSYQTETDGKVIRKDTRDVAKSEERRIVMRRIPAPAIFTSSISTPIDSYLYEEHLISFRVEKISSKFRISSFQIQHVSQKL